MKIPEKFHNSLENQRFTHCKICDKELIQNEESYLIEKAYRRFPETGGEELLFEVAICMDCSTNMRNQLSKESLERISSFFQERALQRREALSNLSKDELMETCLLSGQKIEEMENYQIYAHCRGDKIAPTGGVYMLGDTIIEEIQDLLSAETRDALNRFSDDHLGTPPELRKLFASGDLVGI